MPVGINPDFDYLYDPQQAPPVGFCACCRREIYARGKDLCERCEEEENWKKPIGRK